MPKVDAFANDSWLQDISLASVSDGSMGGADPMADCMHQFDERQQQRPQAIVDAASKTTDAPTRPPPSIMARNNPKNDVPDAMASPLLKPTTDTASYLIRVPPGFEDRFEDSSLANGNDCGAATPHRRREMKAEHSGGGLSYEAVAVRVPCEYDPQQQHSEFMASALQVIPLTVGNFVGDSQHDMHEMVRILRGAADCIDPTYVYVIDPFVRQFIWESLGTTVMNMFPDILFMRQQLFMHLIQLHLSHRSAVHAEAQQQQRNQHDPLLQQQQHRNHPQTKPHADAEQMMSDIDKAAGTGSSSSAIGIDRKSMNKCRMVDPYLALIQLAIYTDPQPQPPNLYKAAEAFALFGTMHHTAVEQQQQPHDRKRHPTCPPQLGDCLGSVVAFPTSVATGQSDYDAEYKAHALLQQHQHHQSQTSTLSPFCVNYAGHQQPNHKYATDGGAHHHGHAATSLQSSAQQPGRGSFAAGAAGNAPQQPYAAYATVDYSAFMPLHKSSPLRHNQYFQRATAALPPASQLEQTPQLHAQFQQPTGGVYGNMPAVSFGPTATTTVNNTTSAIQQQQAAASTARANLYQQFRLAKRNALYMQATAGQNGAELNRALQKALQIHQQQQQQHHMQQIQQQHQLTQQLHDNGLDSGDAVEYGHEQANRSGENLAPNGGALKESANGSQD